MKKLSYLLRFIFLASCTSNTIFKKPEDLIPSDTMSLLMQDMMVASSAKFVKNLNKQTKINYMGFVYDKYLIDSARFQSSNYYYTSKIDLYEDILTDAKTQLENKKDFYANIVSRQDSIRKDSIKKSIDTLRKPKIILDTLKREFNTTNKTMKKRN